MTKCGRYEDCDYCRFSEEDTDVCEFCEDADQFEPFEDSTDQTIYMMRQIA